MTEAQKNYIAIQRKQSSTLRGEFNTLRTTETRSSEQDTRLTALDGELTAAESEFQTASDALLTRTDHHDGSGAARIPKPRERRELCVRANVGDVYGSILEKRGATDGATAEAQAAHGCAPNQIPLAMLAAPTEVRCDPDPRGEPDRTGGNDPAGVRHGRGRVPGYRPADRRHGAGGLPGVQNPSHCGRTAHGLYRRARHDRRIRRGPARPRANRREFHLPQDGQHAVQRHGQRPANGAQQRAPRKARLRGDRGRGRAVERIEPREPQRHGGDHIRLVSLAVSLQPRRWSVRGHEVGYPGY